MKKKRKPITLPSTLIQITPIRLLGLLCVSLTNFILGVAVSPLILSERVREPLRASQSTTSEEGKSVQLEILKKED